MKDKAQMTKQPQIINMDQNQMLGLSQQQMMNQQQQVMKSQMFNTLNMSQPQQSQTQFMMDVNMNINQHSQTQIMMMNSVNQSQQPPVRMSSQGMNRSYGMWGPHPPVDQLKFQSSMKPLPPTYVKSKPLGRNGWKGKKGNDKRQDGRRKDKPMMAGGIGGAGGSGAYKPPTLTELQQQNRLQARRFFPKKKFNNRFVPFAPRNTTSFIIRAKKSGGIASLVSPSPVTPAVLPTPNFSPSREVLVDMAKEEWGVDGYGSMKGLIRLRSPSHGHEVEAQDDDEEDEGGSSESDVEEHVEVERRLDHDLSRFEMIYPNSVHEYSNCLENRVDDQDTHIAHLEEENLILKERLFLMEREFGDLRSRLQCLERRYRVDEINEEVMENESDNESESQGDSPSMEENSEMLGGNKRKDDAVAKGDNIHLDHEVKEENNHGSIDVKEEKDHDGIKGSEVSNVNFKASGDIRMEEKDRVDINRSEVSNVNVKASGSEGAGDIGMEEKDHVDIIVYEVSNVSLKAWDTEGAGDIGMEDTVNA